MLQPMRAISGATRSRPVMPTFEVATPTAEASFEAALTGARSKHLRDHMQGLLDQILDLSDRLGTSLNRETLDQYREAVRSFLSQVIDRSVSLRRDVRNGNLLSVKTINSSLEKLGQLVVEREQDRLSILDEIGEIKGLLVSIRV